MPVHILIANGVVALIFALTPVIGRKAVSSKLMAWPFLVGFFVMALNGGMAAGGINAPICAILPIIPVMGFCFGGRTHGVVGLLFSFGIVLFLFLAARNGWSHPVLDPATVGMQRVTILVVILFASFAIGATYESSRRTAEQRLVEFSRLASVGTLAAGIAHEINNPLTILLGYSQQLEQMAQEKAADPAKLSQISSKLNLTVKRIAGVVVSLRTYAREENEESINSISLEAIVNHAVALCGERFKNHGVQVRVARIPEVVVYARIRQATEVILNLLHNSFDAVLSANVERSERWISIDFNGGDDFAELAVTDSGAGIPRAIQGKIFAPFFTTKDVGKGTGLGLSVSASIMNQIGGEIFLDTNHPQTRFIVKFPKKPSAARSGSVV